MTRCGAESRRWRGGKARRVDCGNKVKAEPQPQTAEAADWQRRLLAARSLVCPLRHRITPFCVKSWQIARLFFTLLRLSAGMSARGRKRRARPDSDDELSDDDDFDPTELMAVKQIMTKRKTDKQRQRTSTTQQQPEEKQREDDDEQPEAQTADGAEQEEKEATAEDEQGEQDGVQDAVEDGEEEGEEEELETVSRAELSGLKRANRRPVKTSFINNEVSSQAVQDSTSAALLSLHCLACSLLCPLL